MFSCHFSRDISGGSLNVTTAVIMAISPFDEHCSTVRNSTLSWVKRTWRIAPHMSAYDPKRTWRATQRLGSDRRSAPSRCASLDTYKRGVLSRRGGNETSRVHQPACWRG